MPRGKKSKERAQERRDQNRVQPQELKASLGRTGEEGELPCCSAHASGDAHASTSTAAFPHMSQSSVPPTNAGTGITLQRSGKRIKGQVTSRARSAGSRCSSEGAKNDLVHSKTKKLMDYMLSKYKMNEPFMRGEMVRVINKRFKEQFPEILEGACHLLDVGFGLELEEVQPKGKSFKLVSKLYLNDDGSDCSHLGMPTMGILIPVLSFIYLNEHCAPEEKIWLLLNQLGIYDGIPHIILGDARKVITHDLVQEKYLEYHLVPHTDPPTYEFLWGSQAYTAKCMEKVLEFVAKYKEYVAHCDSAPYEDAWWQEEEKGKAECAAKGGTKDKAKGHSKGKSSRSKKK
uniref:melanoma-associated antigen B4-like n=1 Tax=Jaculus jaculus TaxID=51337 RepID=UPI001E1B1468|nr:melanoma-associated antigen B4-like [Jaculus jaculus]